MNTPVFTFDVAYFRENYPEFSDQTKYSDVFLQQCWDTATCYVSPVNYGALNGDCRFNVLNMLTAHCAELARLATSGQTPGMVQSSTIDKISVAMTPPPLKSQFAWWMNLTPYGQRAYALLQLYVAGGIQVGGFPESSAIRKVGGVF